MKNNPVARDPIFPKHPSGPWMLIPFVLLLTAIAVMPFLAPHWWEHHYPKVAVILEDSSPGIT